MVKVALYVRWSQDKQGQDDNSADRQLFRINKAIEQNGWEIREEHKYIEETYAAGDEYEYRYQWQKLLKDVEKGEFTIVLAADPSRLDRTRPRDRSIDLALLDDNEIKIYYTKEGIWEAFSDADDDL